jgi:lipoate---protein ligase
VTAAWRVEEHRGPAGDHVALPHPDGRTVRLLDLDRPALVLGSSQPADHVDEVAAARAGVEIARRRSGGGAVLVGPGIGLWWDVFVPAGDPLWDPDVSRAFHWLGRSFAGALHRLGLGASFWDGPMRHHRWSRQVCFAGLGPGEVIVDGRKAVGLSQRRTRAGALFQCCVLLAWDPDPLLALLALDPAERDEAAAQLQAVATGIGGDRARHLPAAFLDAVQAASG